uniref:UBA domain-containing protein n=1 Tax=Caenorhabditis tropicalis TaxID=1561998 RepID=A0A1I7TH09_9PELO
MVFLQMKTTCKEIPISDIIATGHVPFFTDVTSNCAEFRGEKNLDRFRLIYNGRVLKEDDLKNITDNDSIRVILLPESNDQKLNDESSRKSFDSELQTLSSPFKNSEDRRIHGFNHDLSLPEHVSNLLKKYPELVYDSHLLCVFRDWYLFRAYCLRNSFKKDDARNNFKYMNPDFMKYFKDIVVTIGEKYGYNMGEQRGFAEQRRPGAAPVVSHALLQNALQAALAGVGLPPAPRPQAAAPPPVQAPTPQPAEEPMQQGYEQQAATLREYGFENEELIQLALEQSNGDLQAAMEFLIELQN